MSEFKSRLGLSISSKILEQFDVVCKRMGWDSKSLVVENALIQIIDQYSLKPLVIVECDKCTASFSVALWDKHPNKYERNKCITCQADLSSQLISNVERSEDATQPTRDQQSVVQEAG